VSRCRPSLRGEQAWPVVLDAALGDVAVEEILDARVAAFADLAQKLQDGHRGVLGPAFSQVFPVGIDQGGTVLRCPPHLLGLWDSRVALDGVQREVQPPGAFQQADTRVEQVMHLVPAGKGGGCPAVEFAHPGRGGPAATVNRHFLRDGLGEVVPDVPPVADLQDIGQGLVHGATS
jgi:hypothetical protein